MSARAALVTRVWPAPALAAAAAALVLVLAGAFLLGAPEQGFAWVFYLLANLIVFLDLLDLGLRLHFIRGHTRGRDGRRVPTSVALEIGSFTPHQMKLHMRPWALVASVHDAEDYVDDFLEAFRPWHERLWVIDDASADNTFFRLERAGVHCLRSPVNVKKPGAIRALLAQLPAEIETVVVLDPDARILDSGRRAITDLEQVLFEFQRSGHAALCPRIVVRSDGWLARLQSLEYGLACTLGRRSLADHAVTSGVAVYRRDALAAALDAHTLSVYAEDLENAVVLLQRGERIYYDPRLCVQTDGKRSWTGLLSQRVGWSYGLARVYLGRLPGLWRACRGRPLLLYQYGVYMGLLGLLLHPLRLASVALLVLSTANGVDLLLGLDWIPDSPASAPAYFLLAYFKYLVYALLGAGLVARDAGEWLQLLPTVPVYLFYALGQVVPMTLGYLNWLSLRLLGRRVYRDHYQDLESLRGRRET